MKMKLKILLFFLATIGIMASFNMEKRGDGNNPDMKVTAKPDTSVSSLWIKIDSINLGILPPSSGVQFYRNGIVFLSSSKFEDNIADNHISFGKADARYADLNGNKLENQKVFSVNIPFTFPCEAMTFSSDYNTMYYTKYSKNDGVEKIFKGTYKSDNVKLGNWEFDDNPVSFCLDKSTYTHPTLSANGQLMVFASNKTGSVGGMDLYASILKDGTWSDPKNLGDAVNSTANELYPYLDGENNLFFSSDGAQGFGGYDIYVCKYKGNTWEKPVNLSTPVNTMFDDVAFTISRKDSKSAFYTIKENSGMKAQQLCLVTMSNTRPDTLLTLSQYFTRPDISQMVILALEPAVQATDIKSETASSSRSEKDVITYRVQFMTSFNPRTRPQINVNGKDYIVYEFLYSGAYRLCIGEFSSLPQAVELHNLLLKNDYPRATVLAFKNDILSLDPELLKVQPGPSQVTQSEQKKVTEAAVVTTATKTATTNINKPVTEVKKSEPAKETISVPETKNADTPKTVAPVASAEKKDVIVYRVQLLTNSTPKGSYKITIANKVYTTFEYLYAGGYRTCVGDFSTLTPAKELQNTCRQAGHPQAFVVAFKNNVRSTDPALFK